MRWSAKSRYQSLPSLSGPHVFPAFVLPIAAAISASVNGTERSRSTSRYFPWSPSHCNTLCLASASDAACWKIGIHASANVSALACTPLAGFPSAAFR
ncbi:hypothetical protein PF005_g32797 [Phytophthora fragariae]|uniref:Uncharacterized protein n=1 Tax=Phytophthora fragariae TaxID=53985 RepID=A0A6A3UY93_9STRA|nr:hypothetical protein PF009_g33444 [Phytophthora fragariae]KAE8956112.1 hypothetical protein PF011_g31585 [Phytophthora fragariae]KAE9054797.1 hypothetical protein PF010_g32382 [Phytophthora fragariae]KAE9080314.1 hypothetical protein PF006_g27340 [Phytophthora fragariae]KAE9157525.1 hypothetical protein PF005_g32797 [Phytophthora fragariae]